MNPAIYWKSALGLFWAFIFFVLLSLVVGMTYLDISSFYPYAIFLSAILLLFLTAFLLFNKRIKAGLYMCLILSSLFVFNQLLTLYFLFIEPDGILPIQIFAKSEGITKFFPVMISFFLLLWGLLLFFATWKSKSVFEAEAKEKRFAWLMELKKEEKIPVKKS